MVSLPVSGQMVCPGGVLHPMIHPGRMYGLPPGGVSRFLQDNQKKG